MTTADIIRLKLRRTWTTVTSASNCRDTFFVHFKHDGIAGKVGLDSDEQTIAAVRSATQKPLRVDANEGWTDREVAACKIDWLSKQNVRSVEQTMPADRLEGLRRLHRRAALPPMGDESCRHPEDVPKLAGVFDGLNIKLDKTGGMGAAFPMVQMARALGFKTMLGRMVSNSCSITAAGHLSPMVDYADLDGNLPLSNGPYRGVTVDRGKPVLPRRRPPDFRHRQAAPVRAACLAMLLAWLLMPRATLRAQMGTQADQGGSSTGGVHAAVHDAQNRPITAGGFVKSGPVVFQDVAKQAGLTVWRHQMGTPEKQFILEAVGSGVALLDYDNDGWLDIYMVNGSTYDAMSGKATPPHAALFHNNHDGTFTDVAGRAGVTNDRWGFGVAVGDFDNDGWPDIYVANFGKNRLYRNNHDGTFTDVAEKAGVALGNWSTGVTFGDYDGDGRLDIFVAGYVHYDLKNPPVPGSSAVASHFCRFRGVSVMCGPRGLRGEGDHLFHNNGDGTFTDVGVKAGVSDPNRYYGFTPVFADFNNDGKPDLAVADDSTPNYLYINKGNGTFADESYASGFALNQDGREIAAMGLAVGDYRNNGLLDIMTTNFSDDYKVLYRNDGDASFTDVSYQAGLAKDTIPFLGWGVGFLDFDNDGWKDILMVNGHVYPAVDKRDWGTTYAERPLLYRNDHGKTFAPVPAVEGTGLAVVISGRGAAFGDLFNNGKIDAVINVEDGVPVLLKNVNPDHHHWVELRLVGGRKSPRDAVGASVYLTANGMRQRSDVLSGGSYISSNDPRVHFGLGDATAPGVVEIHWPSGAKEKIALPGEDRIFTVVEGKGIVSPHYQSKVSPALPGRQ